jgi:hypothetical protein
MALSVNEAFDIFNQDYVNLDSDRTKKARSSRDWLFEQLNKLPDNDSDFPLKYEERHVNFGSFARNTKIRELDDIDVMFCLHANNAYYSKSIYIDNLYLIHTENSGLRLKNLSDNNTLNSRKVVNQFVSSLSEIENYRSADIHRREEAATLQLSSYEWNFDIVPSFYTTNDFYLIPNGSGNWKATNPPLDQNNITRINQKHNGSILQIVRTLKYWNRRAQMPTITSYLFENLVLKYFDNQSKISDYIDFNMINFWLNLKSSIYENVIDPKGIEGNLNDLSYEDKSTISSKASNAYDKGFEAYKIEIAEKDPKKSINKWREIFGNDFPTYG